jgi:hypothetical protein
MSLQRAEFSHQHLYRCSLLLYYRRQSAAAALVELDGAVGFGEKGVIAAAAHVSPGVVSRPPLAGNNRARFDH